jgi:hypothetical protein
MIDLLVRGAIAAGAAVAAYFAATTVTKAVTGKHIHEHAYSLWCDFRNKITNWLRENQHRGFTRLIGRVVCLIDDAMAAAKLGINMVVEAEDATGHRVKVTEDVLSAEEVARMVPDFKHRTEATLSLGLFN